MSNNSSCSCQDVEEMNGTIPFYIKVTSIIICTFNILLHIMGSHLLIRLFKRETRTVQQLLLINIAVCETLVNFIRLLAWILVVIQDFHPSPSIDVIILNLLIVYNTGLFYNYFAAMFFITADRIMATFLNIRYHVYSSLGKAKWLLFWTWFLNTAACIVIPLIYRYAIYHCDVTAYRSQLTDIYIQTSLSIIFLLFAIYAYTTIFLKFSKSRKKSVGSNPYLSRQSTFTRFRQSRFYVAVLLITSLLILDVIPYLIYIALRLQKNIYLYPNIRYYLYISTYLSDTFDGIIYIYMNSPLRHLLIECLCCIKKDYYVETIGDLRSVKPSNYSISTLTEDI